jgi:hypothetical protein
VKDGNQRAKEAGVSNLSFSQIGTKINQLPSEEKFGIKKKNIESG